MGDGADTNVDVRDTNEVTPRNDSDMTKRNNSRPGSRLHKRKRTVCQ